MNTTTVYDMHLYLAVVCVIFLNRDSICRMLNETQRTVTHDLSLCILSVILTHFLRNIYFDYMMSISASRKQWIPYDISFSVAQRLSMDAFSAAPRSPTKSAASRLISVRF